MFRYFIIHKPYQVLSQFSSPPHDDSNADRKKTLKDFFKVPHDVYPVGRLDYDSEGLLILTNDPALNKRLLHPAAGHEREYWVQVEGITTEEALGALRHGVAITVDGKPYVTKKLKAERFPQASAIGERNPPIRFRKNIPDDWLKLIITEGKNRQVRKMTAKVGLPTLRLIRYRIEGITLERLAAGEMKEYQQEEIYNLLFKK